MERSIIREGKFLIMEEINPINRICVIKLCEGAQCLALAEISPVNDKWVFNRIFVAEEHRAKGYGSAVLSKLTEYLDKNLIDLYAYVYSSGSLNERQLVSWYKRYGFISLKDGDYPLVRPCITKKV